jgi:NADH dehydrogenase
MRWRISAGLRSPGWPAWLVWTFAHIFFLIGFRTRIVVALEWLWAYVTFRRGARIILAETARRDGRSTVDPAYPRIR